MADVVKELEQDAGKTFKDVFKRSDQVLGKGGFSSVVAGRHLTSGKEYAIKMTDTSKMNVKSIARLRSEFDLQSKLTHKTIVKVYGFFDEPPTNYIAMELLKGGELFDRIVHRTFYTESDARRLCTILLGAIAYLHANKIAHRDLKPENIFLLEKDDDTTIKIGDFGFAKRVEKPKSLTTGCGTLSYMAPELIRRQSYDERADMWSIGVILYILLAGYSPFNDSLPNTELAKEILSGKIVFHREYWSHVSKDAIHIIQALLSTDMDARPSAKWALLQPWIAVHTDENLSTTDLSDSLRQLKVFNAKRKMKGAMHAVHAAIAMKKF